MIFTFVAFIFMLLNFESMIFLAVFFDIINVVVMVMFFWAKNIADFTKTKRG